MPQASSAIYRNKALSKVLQVFFEVNEVTEVIASLEVIDICHADGFLTVRYRR